MVAWYFVLAFAITWSLQLPALLAAKHVIAGPPDAYMALVGLGAFGPMAAAMIAARMEGTGVRALLRPSWLYLVFVPFMVGGSILFAWIYQHTRGSLLLAVLTHVGAHLNNPGHAMPARWAPMVIHTVAYALLAIILLRTDPDAWENRTRARP